MHGYLRYVHHEGLLSGISLEMIHFEPTLKELNEIESVVRAHQGNTVKLSREQLVEYLERVKYQDEELRKYWEGMDLSDFRNATELYLEISKMVYSLESLILSVLKQTSFASKLIWTHEECLNLIRSK